VSKELLAFATKPGKMPEKLQEKCTSISYTVKVSFNRF
jgi:hypothetical protein